VGVIIGLGFGHREDGKPGGKMRQRVGTAVEAFKQKRAKYILFCGGYTSGHVAEAEEMKVMAQALGVPARSILMENGSLSTVENARNSEIIIKKKKFRSALLVTHKGHMDRAFRAFRKLKRLRKLYRKTANDYLPEELAMTIDAELPPFESLKAVVVHGRSRRLDFRGDTLVLDRTQLALARTMVYLYQQGLSHVPFYIWHRAYGVGHVTRAEVIGLAAIALGMPDKVLEYSAARRFGVDKRDLFEACNHHGWERVLAILPADRVDEVELIEQQYMEHGIEATVIVTGKLTSGGRKK